MTTTITAGPRTARERGDDVTPKELPAALRSIATATLYMDHPELYEDLRRVCRQSADYIDSTLEPMMRLTPGDALVMSDMGKSEWPDAPCFEGTFVGYGRKPNMIRVRIGDSKTPLEYHWDFWQKVGGPND